MEPGPWLAGRDYSGVDRSPATDTARSLHGLRRLSPKAVRTSTTLIQISARPRLIRSNAIMVCSVGANRIGRTVGSGFSVSRRLLRLIPPPARFVLPLRALPQPLLRRGTERLIDHVLAGPLAAGALDDLAGRRLGVEVTDLGLRWVAAIGKRRVEILGPDNEAESTVRGHITDLLLLASRLEDADTLFFQRRLQLTGDTELGLTVRNLLDQLPWETMPLGLRIVLNRGAQLARAARAAYRGQAAEATSE